MINKGSRYGWELICISFFTIILLWPISALAQDDTTNQIQQEGLPLGFKDVKQLEPIQLENPLTGPFGATSLISFFTDSIPRVLIFCLGIVTMIVFLLNALRYLFSAGGDDTKKAIQGMTYAALGAAVVVFGYMIISLTKKLFT